MTSAQSPGARQRNVAPLEIRPVNGFRNGEGMQMAFLTVELGDPRATAELLSVLSRKQQPRTACCTEC